MRISHFRHFGANSRAATLGQQFRIRRQERARHVMSRLMLRGAIAVAVSLLTTRAAAQEFSQRGFIETQVVLYPQTAQLDRTRVVAEALLRYEPALKVSDWLRLAATLDARRDTHEQVTRAWTIDWRDRGIERPSLSVRRLVATFAAPHITVDVGKQFVRWGRTDIVNPTDRFAPRDFLAVTDNDFLGVTAARLAYESRDNTIDFVVVPSFTPSRIPLAGQRWTVLRDTVADASIHDHGSRFPGGTQMGVRWSRVGSGYEVSLCFYDGFNHLPSIDVRVTPRPFQIDVTRAYPAIRMYGADTALPLRWLTVKGEIGYFATDDKNADEYVLYVLQVERQAGEWFIVGGYTGEIVTTKRSHFDFAPDRGLTRAFVTRAGYTVDVNRSVAVEAAVRQSGDGIWTKAEYTSTWGQHWRTTVAATVIRGTSDDFLGQYRRNSHATVTARYSF